MKPDSNNNKDAHPLNQILYGPPGTGKTWQTANYAIAIIEDREVDEVKDDDRATTKGKFEELKKRGLVEMVTFHQSFTYEDFVEGIKPKLDQTKLAFKIEEGIFKRICKRARVDLDLLLEAFAKYVEEKSKEGNAVRLDNEKNEWTIERADDKRFYLDGINRQLPRDKIKELYLDYQLGNITTPSDIPPKLKSKFDKHGLAPYYFPLLKTLELFCNNEYQQNYHKLGKDNYTENTNRNNFVLIIDEINRGNIAKIFGELITLIEDTKRFGAEDEASVTLPYSKEIFSVPNNVYIIGTMNTADRSIALLDTALRRRFKFNEMMPETESINTNFKGINLQSLLAKMNERIVVLIDRDHQIGQTYFLDISSDDCSIEDLKEIFQKSIIPLLQEYFYDNWGKIDLVLNRNGFVRRVDSPGLFKANELVDDEKIIYELLPEEIGDWDDPQKYIDIYEIRGK